MQAMVVKPEMAEIKPLMLGEEEAGEDMVVAVAAAIVCNMLLAEMELLKGMSEQVARLTQNFS